MVFLAEESVRVTLRAREDRRADGVGVNLISISAPLGDVGNGCPCGLKVLSLGNQGLLTAELQYWERVWSYGSRRH